METEAVSMDIKRKRGRPPKPKTESSSDNIENKAPPKKRGRPPKEAIEIETSNKTEVSEDVQEGALELNHDSEQPIKRKRGRPPKDKSQDQPQKSDDESKEEDQDENLDVDSSAGESIDFPKRKRGRPPKQKGDKAGESKKKRGRPSKTKIHGSTDKQNGDTDVVVLPLHSEEATLKRKRGRPPKAKQDSEAKVETSTAEHDTESKIDKHTNGNTDVATSNGLPTKQTPQETDLPKKKRGRPPKVQQ